MSKWHQGVYTPKNPQKYIGKRNGIWRSSWELVMFQFCDNHPSVVQWGSECVAIPYYCPLAKKVKRYIPDFYIVYIDQNGAQHAEIVEIKPSSQTGGPKTKRKNDILAAARNQAKWLAAQDYCAKNGLSFRVLTEEALFKLKGNQ